MANGVCVSIIARIYDSIARLDEGNTMQLGTKWIGKMGRAKSL